MPASPLGTSKAARLPFHGSWKVDFFLLHLFIFLSRNCFFQRGLAHKSTRLSDDVLCALGRERKCLIFFFLNTSQPLDMTGCQQSNSSISRLCLPHCQFYSDEIAFFQRGLFHESMRLNDHMLSALGRQRKCLIFLFLKACQRLDMSGCQPSSPSSIHDQMQAIALDRCSAPSRGNAHAVSLASIVSREPCLARPLPRAKLASRQPCLLSISNKSVKKN